jgi:5-(carboxyamino)imidazole ribonucleotide synthase
VPLSAVEALPQDLIAPDPRALEIAQDRLNEKRFVEELGARCAPYMRVDSDDELSPARWSGSGTPGILKTARDGYDGKGQWRVMSAHEAEGVRFPGRPCVYEGMVDFADEFSVILVRSASGEVRFWDSTANFHESGMLVKSVLPAGDAVERTRRRGARDFRQGRPRAWLCRRADARILRHTPRPGLQRNGPARAQFRPLDHRGCRH